MMTHELKCWPEYFDAIVRGEKTFELRYNDRDFKVGDTLNLRRYMPETSHYTGAEIKCLITYVMIGSGRFGLERGCACLGIKPDGQVPDETNLDSLPSGASDGRSNAQIAHPSNRSAEGQSQKAGSTPAESTNLGKSLSNSGVEGHAIEETNRDQRCVRPVESRSSLTQTHDTTASESQVSPVAHLIRIVEKMSPEERERFQEAHEMRHAYVQKPSEPDRTLEPTIGEGWVEFKDMPDDQEKLNAAFVFGCMANDECMGSVIQFRGYEAGVKAVADAAIRRVSEENAELRRLNIELSRMASVQSVEIARLQSELKEARELMKQLHDALLACDADPDADGVGQQVQDAYEAYKTSPEKGKQ